MLIISLQPTMLATGVGICVRMTEFRGRGVFATKPFKEGETIETCPVIVLVRLPSTYFRWYTLITLIGSIVL